MVAQQDCEDTADPMLLRQSGSDAADVRVVRVGDVDLFLPSSWLVANGLVQPINGPPPPNISVGALEPTLRDGECNGRIHRLREGRELVLSLPREIRGLPAGLTELRIRLRYGNRRGAPPSTEPGLIDRHPAGAADQYSWARFGAGDVFLDTSAAGRDELNSRFLVSSPAVASGRTEAARFPNHGGHTARSGVQIGYDWSENQLPQPRWRELRLPMTRLVQWLATPPRDRAAEINLAEDIR